MTFGAAETTKTFTLAATDDTEDDDGESVVLTFGMLPDGVDAGTPAQATVTIVEGAVEPTGFERRRRATGT